ncbi:MAG: hypothetical protein SFY66_24435 [Oculatellaceae cyanobacterium bins.114]|nr:hypothetical protein [Oculatellaceae cyanobacterium bins.114]
MVRLALVLAIAGGLVLFALQNLTPISLVVLGVPSQPLPLAVWLLGAIVSGALTTLLISGLFSASNAFASPRARRPGKRSPNRVSANTSTAWNSTWANPKSDTPKPPRSNSQTTTGDDWEPRPPLEEWEDWDGYEEPVRSPSKAQASYSADRYTQPEDRSTPVDQYAQEPSRYPQPNDFAPTVQDQEVWDDWDESEAEDELEGDPRYSDRVDPEDYPPRRTDFEVQQEPVARYQSGTIYSYSYRSTEDREASGVSQTEDVYDAEFRVITPPYAAESTDSEPDLEPDLEDDLESDLDSDRAPVDTDDWLDEDEDEPSDRRGDDPRGRTPSADDW